MGQSIPDYLWRPEPLPGYEDWPGAFWEMGTERQIGFGGLGPIPRSTLDDWAVRMELSEEETQVFLGVMRRVDHTYTLPKEERDLASPAPALSPLTFDRMFGVK